MIPTKRKIDLTCYKRLGMYEAFKDRQLPCFSITCNVDITNIVNFAKSKGYRFFITMSHGICTAINRVPELRQRLIDGELYEFERVDPGYTILLDDSTFSFCDSRYLEKFSEYYEFASQRIESVKACPDCGKGEKHHMVFITNLPWISFTSITHPYDEKFGSIPVIAIGKYFRQGDQIIMPVGIQAHHGIVDGFHAGSFFEHLNRIVHNLEGFDE